MSKFAWRAGLAALALMFIWFTWRGMLWFFSGDDMMNMYFAWVLNPWRLARAQIMIWMPVYRPLGAAVYRIFYAAFGFHPLPLYVFCWLLLALNASLSVRFFRVLRLGRAAALVAAAFALVHGNFQDLYLSAGTMYDRFWFLFTVLGIIVYARSRIDRRPPFAASLLLCLLAMNSKESGVALPALLACCEAVYIFPELRRDRWRSRLKSIAPLYGTLAAMSLLFIFGRVKRTPELAANTLYQPHLDAALWFTRLADYWRVLTYRHVPFTAFSAGMTLLLLGALAVALRNKAMIFGWLFFAITITPVALIAMRPGYVLYVPDLGLGLYLGALFEKAFERKLPRLVPQVAAFGFLLLAFALHTRNWPPPDTPQNPEYQLSTQMREQYAKVPRGAKFLLVNDNFPPGAWDATFDLRMLYGDPTITVKRTVSSADQQPDPREPAAFQHVFALESGVYRELDNRNYVESMRLHLLRDYAPGRELDFTRRDHVAYLLTGVNDGDASPSTRWTEPSASFKFDILPAASTFTAKFWVPDFVAKSGQRALHVLVNGNPVGDYPLSREGMNELAFPVEPQAISERGITIVELNVSNPYRDKDGVAYGVVLLRAGFEFRPGKEKVQRLR